MGELRIERVPSATNFVPRSRSSRTGRAFVTRTATSRTRGTRGTPTGGAAGLRSRGRAGTPAALKDSLTVALTDSQTGCGKDPEQARLVAWWAAGGNPNISRRWLPARTSASYHN